MKRTGLIASVSATNLVKVPLRRVVLIGENIELRIVSLVVRCREVAEEVMLFDTGSTDETVQLAEEVQSQVVHYDGEHTPQALARATKAASLDDGLTPVSSRRIHVETRLLAAERQPCERRLGHPLSLP